jgi:DNA (cytosine-5)-methyltransferase 1
MYECKPKYFLLENVMMGEKWEKILSKAIGVNPIMINSSLLSAQNRQRLYWTNIGLEPAGLFGYPQSTIEQPKDKGILLKDVIDEVVDEKYFLSEKLIICLNKRKGTTYDTFYSRDINGKSRTINSRLAAMGSSDNYIIYNMMPRSSKTGKGGTGLLSRKDGKTYCLDTGNTNAIEINDKVRRLTPIECERLQTVKDNYTNHVSDSQRYKMLGNGWTVDVIRHILNYMKI